MIERVFKKGVIKKGDDVECGEVFLGAFTM